MLADPLPDGIFVGFGHENDSVGILAFFLTQIGDHAGRGGKLSDPP